ncbi:hypothetical protein PYW08_000664 [Mythimna loreyi]|uniref:Uncharacterized protein n=1 Tax=Mythimna loreyi TaxID=667449 RepID=A0ACC2RD15_9NEOP|nr:hypothetical protein PYW08_000664 [Mythimna loreyi]
MSDSESDSVQWITTRRPSNPMTSTTQTSRNFERPRIAESAYAQRTRVSAADIALALKTGNFNRYDWILITKAYQKTLRQRFLKSFKERRNMRLRLKSRRRPGSDSGDQASDSSVSSENRSGTGSTHNFNITEMSNQCNAMPTQKMTNITVRQKSTFNIEKQSKRSFDSDDEPSHQSYCKRTKLMSPVKNKRALLKENPIPANNNVDLSNRYQFANPSLPVRKSNHQEQEKVIAKSLQPITDSTNSPQSSAHTLDNCEVVLTRLPESILQNQLTHYNITNNNTKNPGKTFWDTDFESDDYLTVLPRSYVIDNSKKADASLNNTKQDFKDHTSDARSEVSKKSLQAAQLPDHSNSSFLNNNNSEVNNDPIVKSDPKTTSAQGARRLTL